MLRGAGPRRRAATGLALLLVVGLGRSASGAGVRLSGDHSSAGDPGFLVRSPDVRGHQLLRLELLSQYGREPLVTWTDTLELDRVVEAQLFVHARASYPLWHRLLLGVDMPLLLVTRSGPAPSVTSGAARPDEGPGLGDLALSGRFRALGPVGDGWKGAVEVKLWLPTGSAARYAGDGAPSGLGAFALGNTTGRVAWSTEASLSYRRPAELEGVLPLRVGPAVGLSAGAFFIVDAARAVQVGAEAAAVSGFAGGATLLDPRSSALDLLVGVRVRPLGDPLRLGIAAGPGIGQRPGSADYRVLASLSWSPERAPPPPDRDLDGAPDGSDACPELPGVRSGDAAMNGCPDLPRDDDGDSIPDAFDACPREAGLPTAVRATHGCPPRERPRTVIVARRIEISEHVRFATGTADLEKQSARILGEVARVLREHPEMKRLEVQGHTDDTGTDEVNLRLSQARAESVVEWLVGQGIDRGRLVPRGYGRARPSSADATLEGRAQQRRVEFVILEIAGGTP